MDDRVNLPDGTWLGYRSIGSGPENIIMLHGFGANMLTWDDIIPMFNPDRYKLHLLDFPGHGTASRGRRDDYSIPAQADRVASFIETRSLEKTTLIGHSLGGAISLVVAINDLEVEHSRISRIVLIDTPAYPQPIPPFLDILAIPLLGPLLLKLISPELLARLGLQAALSDHNLITRDRIERYASTFRVKGTATAISKCASELLPPNAARLTGLYRHLTQPFQLIWGEQDVIVKVSTSEQLTRDLTRSELAIIPLCGHNPHEEHPNRTFEIIEHFLKNNPIDS